MPGIWMKRRVLPTNYTNLHEKTIGSWFSQASPIKTTAGFSIKSELSLFRHPAPSCHLDQRERSLFSSFLPTQNSLLSTQHYLLPSPQSPLPSTHLPQPTFHSPPSRYPQLSTQHYLLPSPQSPVPSPRYPQPGTQNTVLFFIDLWRPWLHFLRKSRIPG